jgi:hypothetical protein
VQKQEVSTEFRKTAITIYINLCFNKTLIKSLIYDII